MNASSLGTIYQSLVRYLLEEHPLKVDIRADQRFSVVLKNLKAAQKESCMDGEVPGKNKMEPLQEHHIAKCWAEGSFGRDNPTQLVRTAHPTPRNALSVRSFVRSSVRNVFYPHLTRTHTNLICERTR